MGTETPVNSGAKIRRFSPQKMMKARLRGLKRAGRALRCAAPESPARRFRFRRPPPAGKRMAAGERRNPARSPGQHAELVNESELDGGQQQRAGQRTKRRRQGTAGAIAPHDRRSKDQKPCRVDQQVGEIDIRSAWNPLGRAGPYPGNRSGAERRNGINRTKSAGYPAR